MPNKITLIGWIYISGIFIFGCAGALFYKALFLLQVKTSSNGDTEQFNHAYIVTLLFYVAQFCNVFLVLYDKYRQKKQQKITQTQNISFNLTTLLTFFGVSMVDVIGSTLYNLSVNYGLLSIIQMIRNCTTLFVAMFNSIFFKQFRQDWHLQQTIGITILTAALIGIAVISMFYDDEQSSASNNTLGIILCIISCLFSSIVFTIEEFIFRNVNMSGMQVATSEGLWGVVIYICIIFTLNFDYKDGVPIDSMSTFNYQFTHYWEVPFYIICYMLSTIFYGCSCLQVTKYVNAVARSMMDASKTLLVWIFTLIFGWEQLNAVSTPLKFIMYCLVVFGTLMYNNVIIFKCLQPKYVRIGDNEEKSSINDTEL